MRDRRAVFMVLIAAVMWGTTGTARALAPASASPLAVGAVRVAIGGAILVVLALARGSLTRARWPLGPTLAVALGVAAYQLSFFEGVARAGVAVGTIVAIGSAPLFAGVLALVTLGERPSRRWAVATTLALAGVVLLSTPPAGVELVPLALLLPLAAGASYATYATGSKALLAGRDNVAVAAVAFGGGAIVLLPVLAVADLSWLGRPSGMVAALELGVIATALAYVLFTHALARIPVSWGATLSLAEPLTATLLGTVILGETLASVQLGGAALVAAGLLVLATAPAAS
ncbi:MAG TPA: EamA family transporter [Candidatus Limnocylindria bacterium]|nr:EamA family transporter [Candidatus Limnocylindria bacterium]